MWLKNAHYVLQHLYLPHIWAIQQECEQPRGPEKFGGISKCMEYLVSGLDLVTDHSESLIAASAPKSDLFNPTFRSVCPAGWLRAKISAKTQI